MYRNDTPQARAVQLLELMGSDPGHILQDGRNLYVSLPFRRDVNPNVKVFPDGSYHDFSASPGWEKFGLKFYGTLKDLELAGDSYFTNVFNELELPDGEARAYIERRKLNPVGLKQETYHGDLVIDFPMYLDGKIVGIQRRFIGDHVPKNVMWKGSNATDSIFMQMGDQFSNTVYVCEGATDTATDFLKGRGALAIGAPSCSSLGGVIRYLGSLDSNYEIVLCFDGDEPGQEAQDKVYVAIKDRFEKIYELEHTDGCKDLNDEWNKKGGLIHKLIDRNLQQNIFVRVVDDISLSELNEFHGKELNFVGFFPPDFPGEYHTFYPDPKAKMYVFPESFSRTEVNKLMWKLQKSAYILRGF